MSCIVATYPLWVTNARDFRPDASLSNSKISEHPTAKSRLMVCALVTIEDLHAPRPICRIVARRPTSRRTMRKGTHSFIPLRPAMPHTARNHPLRYG